jgi:hypothetical protein
MNARGTYRKACEETTGPASGGRENASINDVIPERVGETRTRNLEIPGPVLRTIPE